MSDQEKTQANVDTFDHDREGLPPTLKMRINPNAERVTFKETYGNEEYDVMYIKSRNPLNEEDYRELVKKDPDGALFYGTCPEFKPSTYTCPEDPMIICERDVPTTMRDGAIIYSDIYRPVGETDIPVIISWSFFGKRPNDGVTEFQLMGVPPGTVSNLGKFESPDPAYWCRHGYAVANVDSRGCEYSEGNVKTFGSQDGRDGYDYIEWISQQWWCNGNCGMAGNSGVAMAHWWIAAEQPPHLACIAPWEGTSDIYRESITNGGIPAPEFNLSIMNSVVGKGYVEDMSSMIAKYPEMNSYWEDKIPDFKKVICPAYIAACWQHFHLRGTMNAWRKIKTKKKWLRTHREFEWPDASDPENLADLLRFYDRYLKGIRNGWELTPRVRLNVMDSYEYDYFDARKENEFPIKRTDYKKLYLNAADSTMAVETPVESVSKVSYDSATGEAIFDYVCPEDMELSGYAMLRMYVEADGNDDMDLFVTLQKADAEGNWLPTSVLEEPHPGTWGNLRVSCRELDPKLSTKFQPVISGKNFKKLSKGEIVPVDIEFVPISRFWHKGEKIRVRIAGRYIREGWFEPLSWVTNSREGDKHIIHTGGEYESYLQVPCIPPKYVTGDGYIYR